MWAICESVRLDVQYMVVSTIQNLCLEKKGCVHLWMNEGVAMRSVHLAIIWVKMKKA